MAKPALPPVAKELWSALLTQLIDYRKAEPWRWMPDSAVAAYVDAAGQSWFATVLGNAGQVFGLALHRGSTGLRFLRKVQEMGADFHPAEHRHAHDAVTVWYGPKSDLDREQRQRYRDLGFAPKQRDRLGWPDVRSHRPGFFPWHPEESEIRALLEAIPRVLCFAEFYRRHPDSIDEHGPLEIPTFTFGASPDKWEWRVWLNPTPEEIEPAVSIDPDMPILRHATSLPQAHETIELDWFYTPEPVVEGGRPFYPRCVAAVRTNGGYCFGMELIQPDEDAAVRAAGMILHAIKRLGARPAQILTTKEDLAARLRPLATSLGAESLAVRHLASFDEFRASLEAHFGMDTPRRRKS